MNEPIINTWAFDWIWSLPLIVVTVLFHTFNLGLMDDRITSVLSNLRKYRMPHFVSMLVMGATVLSVTFLHGIEAIIWAVAFWLIGAVPDYKSAMLYSLGAMTTYGHADLHLERHWQLMGALEALNGMILFGLTTAFLFTIIQKLWPHVKRG